MVGTKLPQVHGERGEDGLVYGFLIKAQGREDCFKVTAHISTYLNIEQSQ